MTVQPAPQETEDDDVPKLLIARGWSQGAVFRAPDAQFWCLEEAPGSAGNALVGRGRDMPTDGRFVVTSQTCDIAAPISIEPTVEAIACAPEADPNKRAGYRSSFRWFEIDRANGLIAHAMYRVAIDKRALLSRTPQPWPDTRERFEEFRRWMARRAGRPAIPNEIVDAFVKPLKEKVVRRLRRKDPQAWAAFNKMVQDIRISLPESTRPPFEINMVFLLRDEEATAAGADAIETIIRELRMNLKPSEAILGDALKLSPRRMSVQLFHDTALVDLESFSYEGDELVGAEQSPPA